MKEKEKRLWESTAKTLIEFYEKMKLNKHINFRLNQNISGKDREAYEIFYKILEDGDKMKEATNLLYRISISPGGSKKFAEKNNIDEKILPYLYLSQFSWSIAQGYELFLNVLKKTLTTNNLTNKKGEPLGKPIEKTALEKVLDMLKKHTETAKDIKEIMENRKSLRNGLSHGLFWYENEEIHWVDSVSVNKTESLSFKCFIKTARTQSLYSECLLWVTGKLLAEDFFSP